MEGHVLNPNVPLAGDDADGNAQDEGQSAVAPGDAVEQVGVLVVGGGRDDGAVGEAELELQASLVEQALNVAGALNAGTAHQPPDGQIVHLGNNGEGVSHGKEGVSDLSHGNERLDNDHPPVGIDLQYVNERVHINSAPFRLVRPVRQADALPSRPGGAQRLPLRAGLPNLLHDGRDSLSVLLRRRPRVADVPAADG